MSNIEVGRSSVAHGEEFSIAGPVAVPDGYDNEPARAPLLLQYLQLLIRWRWVIFSIMLLSVIAGVFVTLMMTPQYTATTRLEISREQKKITNVQGVEADSTGRDLEFYQTQYALLNARTVAERVARQLRLGTNKEFFEAHGVDLSNANAPEANNARLSAADLQKRENSAVGLLLGHVAISPLRGSALVDVSYTSAAPKISAMIANAWVAQFLQASMDRRYAATTDARAFLENRLATLRGRLEQSERDLVNYANSKQIVSLNQTQGTDGRTRADRTLVSEDLQALNSALTQATAQRVAAEARLQGSRGGGASTLELNNQAIALLRQRRGEIAAEYAKMQVQYQAGYPGVLALKGQLDALDASISREERRVRSSLTTEFQQAMEQERVLQARVEGLKGRYQTQQSDSIQYNIYQREADTNRELYEGLLQRYKEIGVANVGANNISVVDDARVPVSPSSPKLFLNVLLALLVGLALSVAATLALDQIDEGLREPSQVTPLLKAPLLGSVPAYGDGNIREALDDIKSDVAEAYLTIRSNLALSTDHGVPRSFLVTSTRPAEGKSTTALALGMVIGRTGKRVLLVDADMRRPSVHGVLGVSNDRGLSNLLAGDPAWHDYILPEVKKNVSVLTAGPIPPSASELLSSDRMGKLLREFMQHYDHVVVDGPPLLGLADAPLLSRSVEGTVYVVEADGVPMRGLRAALGRLRSGGFPILGVVLTKLTRRQATSGYGYGYDYGYGYGYRQDENS